MSPFEIRLELLKMAKDIILEDFYSQKQVIDNNWTTSVDHAQKQMAMPPVHPGYPSSITEQQIIDMATKLNSFVSMVPPEIGAGTRLTKAKGN